MSSPEEMSGELVRIVEDRSRTYVWTRGIDHMGRSTKMDLRDLTEQARGAIAKFAIESRAKLSEIGQCLDFQHRIIEGIWHNKERVINPILSLGGEGLFISFFPGLEVDLSSPLNNSGLYMGTDRPYHEDDSNIRGSLLELDRIELNPLGRTVTLAGRSFNDGRLKGLVGATVTLGKVVPLVGNPYLTVSVEGLLPESGYPRAKLSLIP